MLPIDSLEIDLTTQFSLQHFLSIPLFKLIFHSRFFFSLFFLLHLFFFCSFTLLVSFRFLPFSLFPSFSFSLWIALFRFDSWKWWELLQFFTLYISVASHHAWQAHRWSMHVLWFKLTASYCLTINHMCLLLACTCVTIHALVLYLIYYRISFNEGRSQQFYPVKHILRHIIEFMVNQLISSWN